MKKYSAPVAVSNDVVRDTRSVGNVPSLIEFSTSTTTLGLGFGL